MNELNDCPYCGGEPRIQPEGDFHEVVCLQCGVFIQRHTYEEAVRAWNQEEFDDIEDFYK